VCAELAGLKTDLQLFLSHLVDIPPLKLHFYLECFVDELPSHPVIAYHTTGDVFSGIWHQFGQKIVKQLLDFPP
jgi:hypothetical protein